MEYLLISAHKTSPKAYEHSVAGLPIRPSDFKRDLFHKREHQPSVKGCLLHLWPSAPDNAHWQLCSHGNAAPAPLEGREPVHAFLPGLHL